MRKTNEGKTCCPKCGATMSSISTYCAYCGHELSDVAPNSSMADLAEIIDKIFEETREDPITRSRIRHAILNFPVPNTKNDLFEFTSSMLGRISDDEYGDTYRQKLDECLAKIEALYPNDKYFVSLKQSVQKAKYERRKIIVMIVVGVVVFYLILFVLSVLEKHGII